MSSSSDPFSRLVAKALDIVDLSDPLELAAEMDKRLQSADAGTLREIFRKTEELYRHTDETRKRHIESLQSAAKEAQGMVMELQGAHGEQKRILEKLTGLVAELEGDQESGEPSVTGRSSEALVRQITELVERQKRQTKEIEEARIAAEDATQAKTRFLANMSHEIRTPMNGVLGTLNLLNELDLDEEVSEHVGVMRASGRGMMAVIDDILDISKIQEEAVELVQAPFDLREVCSDVIRTFKPTAETKGIVLKLKSSEELGFVLGDESRVRQILNNLVGNAAKFTEEGSVSLGVEKGENAVRFEVTDTGIGMSEEVVSLLFTPYEQGDKSISHRFGGTGLGLAISKKLAETMGGSITVTSVAGKGSTFTLDLPLAAAEQASALRGPETVLKKGGGPTAPPAHALNVLIADDNEINRGVASKTIKLLGHNPTVAENGRVAVDLVKSDSFDVVLMDLKMPVMDGEEATREIRALPGEKGKIRILAITGDVLGETETACRDAGMDGFLAKPFRIAELRDSLGIESTESS